MNDIMHKTIIVNNTEQDEHSTAIQEEEKRAKAAKDDALLLKRFKEGDNDAFDQIYMRWFTPIYTLLKRITNSALDAEDIVQEVFIILWKSRDMIDISKGVKAYIFSTARHQAFDLLRKQRAADNYLAQETLTEKSDIDPLKAIEAKELELLAEYAILTMPPQRREIFLLNYKEGLSPAEIALRLDIMPQKVSDHLYLARKHLKDILTIHIITIILGIL